MSNNIKAFSINASINVAFFTLLAAFGSYLTGNDTLFIMPVMGFFKSCWDFNRRQKLLAKIQEAFDRAERLEDQNYVSSGMIREIFAKKIERMKKDPFTDFKEMNNLLKNLKEAEDRIIAEQSSPIADFRALARSILANDTLKRPSFIYASEEGKKKILWDLCKSRETEEIPVSTVFNHTMGYLKATEFYSARRRHA